MTEPRGRQAEATLEVKPEVIEDLDVPATMPNTSPAVASEEWG